MRDAFHGKRGTPPYEVGADLKGQYMARKKKRVRMAARLTPLTDLLGAGVRLTRELIALIGELLG